MERGIEVEYADGRRRAEHMEVVLERLAARLPVFKTNALLTGRASHSDLQALAELGEHGPQFLCGNLGRGEIYGAMSAAHGALRSLYYIDDDADLSILGDYARQVLVRAIAASRAARGTRNGGYPGRAPRGYQQVEDVSAAWRMNFAFPFVRLAEFVVRKAIGPWLADGVEQAVWLAGFKANMHLSRVDAYERCHGLPCGADDALLEGHDEWVSETIADHSLYTLATVASSLEDQPLPRYWEVAEVNADTPYDPEVFSWRSE